MRKRRSFEEYAAVATAGYALYKQGQDYYGRVREWRQRRQQSELWTLRVYESEQEFLFHAFGSWALRQLPDGPSNDITVGQQGGRLVQTPPDESDLDLTIQFQGETLPFLIRTQKTNDGQNQIILNNRRFSTGRYLLVVCSSEQQRRDLMAFVEDEFLSSTDEVSPPEIFRATKHGDYRYIRCLVPREPDTVFLPNGMMEDIISDVERFNHSEQQYVDMGIPYHRGYLLHGPPGTGKTTTICSVASSIGMSVYLIPLTELADDSALVAAVAHIPNSANETVLVLEDVDVFHNTHARDDEGQSSGITLEGLLNVLDGFLTPSGLITFMTTNHPERLDEALIRPGRIDRQFELGYINQDQLNQMVKRFVGDFDIKLERDDVTPAQIVECLKSSFDNAPEVVIEKIRKVAKG